MIIDRAIEIMSSKDHVLVLYDNQSVWIDSVDTDSRMATIHVVGTDRIQEVPVASLTDTGSLV
jgi:H-type small acid-soluble spore protein